MVLDSRVTLREQMDNDRHRRRARKTQEHTHACGEQPNRARDHAPDDKRQKHLMRERGDRKQPHASAAPSESSAEGPQAKEGAPPTYGRRRWRAALKAPDPHRAQCRERQHCRQPGHEAGRGNHWPLDQGQQHHIHHGRDEAGRRIGIEQPNLFSVEDRGALHA